MAGLWGSEGTFRNSPPGSGEVWETSRARLRAGRSFRNQITARFWVTGALSMEKGPLEQGGGCQASPWTRQGCIIVLLGVWRFRGGLRPGCFLLLCGRLPGAIWRNWGKREFLWLCGA